MSLLSKMEEATTHVEVMEVEDGMLYEAASQVVQMMGRLERDIVVVGRGTVVGEILGNAMKEKVFELERRQPDLQAGRIGTWAGVASLAFNQRWREPEWSCGVADLFIVALRKGALWYEFDTPDVVVLCHARDMEEFFQRITNITEASRE